MSKKGSSSVLQNNNNNKSSNNNNTSNKNNNNNNHSNHNHNNNSAKQISQEPEITKLDYAVADHMRNNLPNKEAMFVGIKRVNYFIGSKAVDLLMESKWAKEPNQIFTTRSEAVSFLNNLLLKKFYHRARKIVKMDGTKKKFKLDMHDVQVFQDSNQPYVWLYEPTSLKAWLLCFGVIFGVIGVCLFPLWPPIIRTWVYYLGVTGLGFLLSVLSLAILRHIIFLALWTMTIGKLHFWILPNLTEDVGFIESFWPLYTIEKGEDNIGAGDGEVNSFASTGEGSGASHSHQD